MLVVLTGHGWLQTMHWPTTSRSASHMGRQWQEASPDQLKVLPNEGVNVLLVGVDPKRLHRAVNRGSGLGPCESYVRSRAI